MLEFYLHIALIVKIQLAIEKSAVWLVTDACTKQLTNSEVVSSKWR